MTDDHTKKRIKVTADRVASFAWELDEAAAHGDLEKAVKYLDKIINWAQKEKRAIREDKREAKNKGRLGC